MTTFNIYSDELVFSRHDTREQAEAALADEKTKCLDRIERLREEIESEEDFLNTFTIKHETSIDDDLDYQQELNTAARKCAGEYLSYGLDDAKALRKKLAEEIVLKFPGRVGTIKISDDIDQLVHLYV